MDIYTLQHKALQRAKCNNEQLLVEIRRCVQRCKSHKLNLKIMELGLLLYPGTIDTYPEIGYN